MNFTLCIPTYNSEEKLMKGLPAIKAQTLQPQEFWIIDSSSNDRTVEIAKEYGAHVKVIPAHEFNHGGTRNLFPSLSQSDFYLYLTDDAVPANKNCFQTLMQAFSDEKVGMAYGRQLPHENANLFAAHARFFNYPPEARTKSLKDSKDLGVKTIFASNSFAAYRALAFEQAGGFPTNTILSEDTYVAAKMILNGWTLRYEAEACVYHSHNYSIWEEFQRYFDIGVFYGQEKWIKKEFGNTSSEGKKFVFSELKFLKESKSHLYFEWFLRNSMKWLGYKLGNNEEKIPKKIKTKLSMHKNYWA